MKNSNYNTDIEQKLYKAFLKSLKAIVNGLKYIYYLLQLTIMFVLAILTIKFIEKLN